MSSQSSSQRQDFSGSVARPLVVAFGALLTALMIAALISGLIIRELRAPLEFASESAFTMAAQLRDIYDATDNLDLLVTDTQINARTDANSFVDATVRDRATIERALTALPPTSREDIHYQVLDDQHERLFANLDQLVDLESRLWAQQKRAEALSAQILGITDHAVSITRDHNARYAQKNVAMSRALGEVRYYLSAMNNFASSVMPTPELTSVNNTANLYAADLRRAVTTLSRLPNYDERAELFDQAHTLFDLGHDADGYFGTVRNVVQLADQFAQARSEYEILSGEFRASIKDLSTATDETTEITLRAARAGLGRYQTLLITSIVVTLLIGSLVIKRYVYDAVVVRLRALRDTTLEMARGNLETRVDASGDDEISDLANALGTFRNVSQERARSEKRLKQRTVQLELANQELDDFAYVASHDLRAPLHGIDSLASFVQEDMEGKLPEESGRHLNLMRARIQRLHSLLDSMLEFSRVGRDNVEPVWAALHPLIVSSASLIESPGFELVFNVENTDVLLTTTPFEQVVRNLVDNAIKHHDRASGTVWISASVKNEVIHLEVTDDGPGIPPKFHDRIFGMFQTLQARDKIEGSGMGLAFLKKSTTYYGGSIKVKSDPAQARGTTFVIEWPITGQRALDAES